MLALLGFDSASLPLLESLLAEGRLPGLAQLRADGRWLRLETPAVNYAAGTYHSLYSGLDVGEHGLYYPFQWVAAEQRIRLLRSLPAPEAVWERLSQAGRRCLVIDPYEAQSPSAIHGLCLSGWQFRNRVVQSEWAVSDVDWRPVARAFSRAPKADEVFGRTTASYLRSLGRRLLEGPNRAAALACELLRRDTYDLLWITFSTAHLAGHQFWDVGIVGVAPDDPLTATLAAVYEAVDRALGRIVEALPTGCDVVVYSALGMGPNCSRIDMLPGMLQAVLHGRARRGAGGIWRLRALAPTGLRAAVADALPEAAALELTCRLETRGVNWRETRAFVLPADHNGHVRLNVKGRERDGAVDPADADALVEEIATGLLEFEDPSGGPAIAGVDRSTDLEHGSRVDWLPDLVVRFPPRPSPDRVVSSRLGEVRRPGVGSGRSGNHLPDAWALVVPGRSRHREPSWPPRVTDLPATATALLGADAIAGEPLLEA